MVFLSHCFSLHFAIFCTLFIYGPHSDLLTSLFLLPLIKKISPYLCVLYFKGISTPPSPQGYPRILSPTFSSFLCLRNVSAFPLSIPIDLQHHLSFYSLLLVASFLFFWNTHSIMGLYSTNRTKSKCLTAAASLLIIKYYVKYILKLAVRFKTHTVLNWLFTYLDDN